MRYQKFVFSLAIFFSAFLLFQIEPLLGKSILPWFGGAASTWTACMLFFQGIILAAYLYSHLLTSRLSQKWQVAVHFIMLAGALAFLPIMPSPKWKPADSDWPLWRITALLASTAGLPCFAVAATSPLLQRWISLGRTSSPYGLYALSNLGSLLALLTYPILVEPWLGVKDQAVAWSCGFVLFATVTVAAALWSVRTRVMPSDTMIPPKSTSVVKAPTIVQMAYWLALSGCGSLALLAATNQISQDIAVVPLLWVIPIALYLVTFILCFQSQKWVPRVIWWPLFGMLAFRALYVLQLGTRAGLFEQIVAYSAAMFACCMVCHGELVRARPRPEHLTLFYLMLAAGGALGGVFVGILAPFLFTQLAEFELSLTFTAALVLLAWFREGAASGRGRWTSAALMGYFAALSAATCLELSGYELWQVADPDTGQQNWRLLRKPVTTLCKTRNFYGALVVHGARWDLGVYHSLTHGRIVHGQQYQEGEYRRLGLTYYGKDTGMAAALLLHPRRTSGQNKSLSIGAIGLGAGTLATYCEAGDTLRFYEINPDVVRLAQSYFTYLDDTLAKVGIVPGDARLSLERELLQGAHRFDVLVVDAFAGDAIPVHLLTRECFSTYAESMKPDGVLAFHLSNLYLDLEPVMRSLCLELGLRVFWVETPADPQIPTEAATWLLATRNEEFIARLENFPGCTDYSAQNVPDNIWTDDRASVFSALHKRLSQENPK